MWQCLAVALTPTIKTSRFVVVTGCTPDTNVDSIIGKVLGSFIKTNVFVIGILIFLLPKSHAPVNPKKVSYKFNF